MLRIFQARWRDIFTFVDRWLFKNWAKLFWYTKIRATNRNRYWWVIKSNATPHLFHKHIAHLPIHLHVIDGKQWTQPKCKVKWQGEIGYVFVNGKAYRVSKR